MKFKIEKQNGFVSGISYGKQWVAHLQFGATLNEHFAPTLLEILNATDRSPEIKKAIARWREQNAKNSD